MNIISKKWYDCIMKNNNNTLSDEELKTLKSKAFDALSHARHVLLSKYPFIGSIALRMDLVPVRDLRVRTACTDGNAVYFDIAFLSSLSHDERIFVLAHEIWHAVLLHLTRLGTRNVELFNIATDKEVNYLLKEDGLIPPPHLCFPTEKEAGKCAEEIYEMMLKDQKQKQKKQQQNNSSQDASNSGFGQNSSSKQNSKNKNRGSSSNSNDDQDDQSSQNKANGNGQFKGQFDKHIYGDNEPDAKPENSANNQPNANGNDKDGNETGNGTDNASYTSKITDKYGDVGYDSDFKPKVPKDFADRMRETVISEAQRVEKMQGNVPAHVKELVKKLMTPQICWQEVLAQFVTKAYNSGNRSWIPPNRRHVHNDIYLQSRQSSKIKLACIIDTSGSTIGDRGIFLGELNSLIKSFGQFSLFLIECDAEVGAIKHYTQDDDLEHIIENGEYAMTGGGGTSMLPGLNAIIDEQMDVDACLVLTDGYIDNIPKNPTGLPTLWIITKDGTEDFNDWGQKIRLKQTDGDLY